MTYNNERESEVSNEELSIFFVGGEEKILWLEKQTRDRKGQSEER